MYTFLLKKCDYNAFVETCVGVYLSLYISLSIAFSRIARFDVKIVILILVILSLYSSSTSYP